MNWKVVAALIIACILLAGLWAYINRNESVYERIIHQQGYATTLIDEKIETEFLLRPEWIPDETGDETQLNLVVDEKFGTKIVLEKVGKRETDFFVQLNLKPDPDLRTGQILSTTLINSNGSYSTVGHLDRWLVMDPAGNDILLKEYGTGDGPSNLSQIFIQDKHLPLFDQGAQIRFSGYALYGYRALVDASVRSAVPFVFVLLLAAAVAVLYRRRTGQEKALVWKLLGYVLLGGFTFSINAVRLPLGFVMYFLFFHKRPKPNAGIKLVAALLGLLGYTINLLMPLSASAFPPSVPVIRNISVEEHGADVMWRALTAQTPVSRQAKISDFKAMTTENGVLKIFTFSVVEREGPHYVLTDVVYAPGKQTLTVKRNVWNDWMQYDLHIAAAAFFDRMADLDLLRLKAADDHPFVKLELREQGKAANYGIKDGQSFIVDQTGVAAIDNEQLPVEGYWITACGTNESGDHCYDRADYLFGS